MKKTAHGFTLVELLIVIVVIAILAAISVVAYNGMNTRAHVAQIAAAADSFNKHINMQMAETGRYSDISSYFEACLGTEDDYPETDIFPAGVCEVDATTHAVRVSVNQTLNDEISARLSSVPAVSADYAVEEWGRIYRGLLIWSNPNIDYKIWTVLPTGMSCPSNMDSYPIDNGVWCEILNQVP